MIEANVIFDGFDIVCNGYVLEYTNHEEWVVRPIVKPSTTPDQWFEVLEDAIKWCEEN